MQSLFKYQLCLNVYINIDVCDCLILCVGFVYHNCLFLYTICFSPFPTYLNHFCSDPVKEFMRGPNGFGAYMASLYVSCYMYYSNSTEKR